MRDVPLQIRPGGPFMPQPIDYDAWTRVLIAEQAEMLADRIDERRRAEHQSRERCARFTEQLRRFKR